MNPNLQERLEEHFYDFFVGQDISVHRFKQGPTTELVPEFRVLCAHPGGERDFYTYSSIGTSSIEHQGGRPLEFLVATKTEDQMWVELLTMVAYYHSNEWLELGHTFPVQHRLFAPPSTCDHLLVSLPYPYGPDLEVCCIDGQHIHFLWLLPITDQERTYRHEAGLAALEELFDEHEIDFLDLHRPSVVPGNTT